MTIDNWTNLFILEVQNSHQTRPFLIFLFLFLKNQIYQNWLKNQPNLAKVLLIFKIH